MKRIIKLVLFFVVLSLLNVASVFAADTAKVVFSPTSKDIIGKPTQVDVFIDSNVPVNAAQVTIQYPVNDLVLGFINVANSKFTIQAEQTTSPGSIKLARGNIIPLKGKNLLASITFTPKARGALSKINYSASDSLVMSQANVNVLSGSQVLTIKPVGTENKSSRENSTGITSLFTQAVKEFFRGLLGK